METINNYKFEIMWKLSDIELCDHEIKDIQKRKDKAYLRLKEISDNIINDNKYLIGKQAICYTTREEGAKPIVCECTALKCTDNFLIKPLFSYAGKKIIVESYEWK